MTRRQNELAIGALGLGKSWLYHGALLQGWDAQFYYAQGRSIAFEGTLDITRSLEGNVCRCGTYARIIPAIRKAAEELKGGGR